MKSIEAKRNININNHNHTAAAGPHERSGLQAFGEPGRAQRRVEVLLQALLLPGHGARPPGRRGVRLHVRAGEPAGRRSFSREPLS